MKRKSRRARSKSSLGGNLLVMINVPEMLDYFLVIMRY